MRLNSGFGRKRTAWLGTRVPSQRQYLTKSERKLEVGPVDMARLLDTNWNTYKAWKAEKNPLPGVARVAIDALIRLKSLK